MESNTNIAGAPVVAPVERNQTAKVVKSAENVKYEDSDHNNDAEYEEIPLGTIVANLAHPYSADNTNVLITTYAHFTPPLMIVIEKNYGVAKYNPITGDKEDNDSYRCLYYLSISGGFELQWFKRRELKKISGGSLDLFNSAKDKGIDKLKKGLLGKMAILTNVDLELDKKKIWSDNEGGISKEKVNNLLDYLPPLASIIDVKLNEDHQKYNEKNGKIIHRKSKVLVKLRWLNNITSKYSEDYVPLAALKIIDKQLELRNYSKKLTYLYSDPINLEESGITVSKVPLVIESIIWKHYYYIYRFQNLFTKQLQDVNYDEVLDETDLRHIINNSSFLNDSVNKFTKTPDENFKDRWFEIQYSDRNDRFTQRFIRIIEIFKETQEDGSEKHFIKAHCLLRSGKIRHFRIERIKGYKEVHEDFVKTFTI
ncbi:hypothetical protein [Sphingobacterium sp.]|uniref:hypothetical protein n=1 Tax=Sphingobacterium sp. TaxID=341027 RepID=UPI00258F3AFA|nr:hypothetical protein [Sphingobacterium sp.]WET67961.1 MAG: hypothetical protein P0Y57_19150 [Sphingobacterium sp.]